MTPAPEARSLSLIESLTTFFRFELKFWLKGYMVWVFVVVQTLIILSVMIVDEALLEDVFFGNALRNSPFVIHRVYGIAAVFGCLMVTAFVNSSASREFACQTDQIIFTKPVNKLGYLLGRFSGATLVSLIPMLGVSLAIFIAHLICTQVPQFESLSSKWGPTNFGAHLSSILIIAVPNTIFISAVVFAIAVWTRSALASFLGILGLMVALSISGALIGSLANESLAAMSDPFGDTAMATLTKYWTVADKNVSSVPFTGLLLWNRVVWLGIGLGILTLACWRFSFTRGGGLLGKLTRVIKSSIDESLSAPFHTSELPAIDRHFGKSARMRQLLRMTLVELWSTLKSPVFICLIVGAFLSVSASLSVRADQGFGLSALPVTFSLVDSIREALSQFQIVLITFFAGVFVWKERDAKLNDIFDALPFPSWISYVSKFLALMVIVASVYVAGICCGMFYQLTSSYYSFQIGVYIQELLVIGMFEMTCLIVLAMLFHVVCPNKYVGYFGFIAFLLVNQFLWPMIGVESRMFQFGALPAHTYSDLFGIAPYSSALTWFATYWGLAAVMIGIATIMLWQRGRERSMSQRFKLAQPLWRGGVRIVSVVVVLMWIAVGSWVYWNTQVVNEYQTSWQSKNQQADYEKQYKELSTHAQPRITDVRFDIDLYPEKRKMSMHGIQTIVNDEDVPIEKIYVTTLESFDTQVTIENATVGKVDERLNMTTYQLDPPMAPGSSRTMEFQVDYDPKGFENSVAVPQIVQNGTFFNNYIIPQIGYFTANELSDHLDREEFQLGESSFVPLDPNNLEARRNHYLSNSSDWVNVETVISTSADQIAVAPGSLRKKWQENGRNYFQYKLDHPSLNFFSFVSARYKVQSRKWKDVDVEVYYHPDHEWNVDLMLRSIRKSLEYYSEAFGPYKHKQARIIEFPRVDFFAQAFPGTMPYSEGVGFIADLQSENDIDMVFYIVAHEMAHQWWAHQVIGANMQGATVLSETLAQYSALMVMEKEYGRDMMRKFLKYELDNYLRSRGREKGSEFPLKEVETNQGYIHYNKGSVVMYHLKETIGEDKLNAALHTLVDRFAYANAPYPTSQDLVDAIREQTPPEHHGLVEDLLEKITLFENKTVSATYEPADDGKFKVTLNAEFKKLYAQSDGEETETEINDWIEIGAFAKPKGGSTFGDTLYRKRFQINQNQRVFEFVVDEEPHRVGVDPFSLLIDRNTADNVKKPELKSGD